MSARAARAILLVTLIPVSRRTPASLGLFRVAAISAALSALRA